MKNLSTPTRKKIAWGSKATVILFSLFYALTLHSAAPLDVAINEIAWMGNKTEGIESKNWWRYEWIELYNNTEETVSLDGWKVELYRAGLDWSLELKGNISTQSYFLIVASDKIPNYDLNYSNLGGKLNNNGQKVILKNATGIIMDEIDCSAGWFAGDNNTKQTMERINSLPSGSDPQSWQTSQNPGGTPKAENIFAKTNQTKDSPSEVTKDSPSLTQPTERQISYPSNVVISEILPSPEGADETDEWIEIFNQNNFEVDISGWEATDVTGKTKIYVFPQATKIPAQGFLILARPTSKITLNNDRDGIFLSRPDGRVVDEVIYEKAPNGQSYNLTLNGWVWSVNLTPGARNQVISTSEKKGAETEKDDSRQKQVSSEGEGTAAIGKFFNEVNDHRNDESLPILFIALTVSLFSGIVILLVKNEIKSKK